MKEIPEMGEPVETNYEYDGGEDEDGNSGNWEQFNADTEKYNKQSL